MDEEKKIDNKTVGFIISGAIIGAIAGYIIKRIGIKNITNILEAKEIIPPNVINTINKFTSRKNSDG